jgi:cyclic pyranopterin phosphate synthase
MTDSGLLIDSHGRVLRDLRVSITDRCNFRCLYCLPETEAAANFYRERWAGSTAGEAIARAWTPRSHLLTFEEIERVVRIAVSLGIQKVRLTGGEPLLRQQAELLVQLLAAIPGISDLAMTSNGFLFAQKAKALRDAGLQRISFSLDSLDAANFKKITGRDGLDAVLAAIDQAQKLGLNPVKVNAVVIRSINDHEIEALGEFARSHGLVMRFIEFMPLDSARAWQKELVVPGREILQRLQARFELQPVKSANASETAKRWTFTDSTAEIGIIAPVSEPFCGHCNRLRLTADGNLRTCLFSVAEHDLRSRLRAGATDEHLRSFLREVVWQKEARHHIGEPEFVAPNRSMSCIGG